MYIKLDKAVMIVRSGVAPLRIIGSNVTGRSPSESADPNNTSLSIDFISTEGNRIEVVMTLDDAFKINEAMSDITSKLREDQAFAETNHFSRTAGRQYLG